MKPIIYDKEVFKRRISRLKKGDVVWVHIELEPTLHYDINYFETLYEMAIVTRKEKYQFVCFTQVGQKSYEFGYRDQSKFYRDHEYHQRNAEYKRYYEK